jgi:hypothetical protein
MQDQVLAEFVGKGKRKENRLDPLGSPAIPLRILKMDYFDFIKELRKGEPDPKKAEKAMGSMGSILHR